MENQNIPPTNNVPIQDSQSGSELVNKSNLFINLYFISSFVVIAILSLVVFLGGGDGAVFLLIPYLAFSYFLLRVFFISDVRRKNATTVRALIMISILALVSLAIFIPNAYLINSYSCEGLAGIGCGIAFLKLLGVQLILAIIFLLLLVPSKKSAKVRALSLPIIFLSIICILAVIFMWSASPRQYYAYYYNLSTDRSLDAFPILEDYLSKVKASNTNLNLDFSKAKYGKKPFYIYGYLSDRLYNKYTLQNGQLDLEEDDPYWIFSDDGKSAISPFGDPRSTGYTKSTYLWNKDTQRVSVLSFNVCSEPSSNLFWVSNSILACIEYDVVGKYRLYVRLYDLNDSFNIIYSLNNLPTEPVIPNYYPESEWSNRLSQISASEIDVLKTYSNEDFSFKYPENEYSLKQIDYALSSDLQEYNAVRLYSEIASGFAEKYFGGVETEEICPGYWTIPISLCIKDTGIEFSVIDNSQEELAPRLSLPGVVGVATKETVAGKPAIKYSYKDERRGDGIIYYLVQINPNKTLFIANKTMSGYGHGAFPSDDSFNQILSTLVVEGTSQSTTSSTIPKTIKLGTYKDISSLQEALEENDYIMSSTAKDMLAKISLSQTERTVNIALITAGEIGIDITKQYNSELGIDTTKEYKYGDVLDKAREMGIELVPAEVGPQLRLQYPNQPNDRVYILMEPIDGGVFDIVSNALYRLYDQSPILYDATFVIIE